jgi:hypothetical protein
MLTPYLLGHLAPTNIVGQEKLEKSPGDGTFHRYRLTPFKQIRALIPDHSNVYFTVPMSNERK